MCDMEEDGTVEHVVLECEKYDRDRMEMLHVILTEMGREMNEMIEKIGRVLLVGLCGQTNTRMIDTVKEFLEKMLYARSRN